MNLYFPATGPDFVEAAPLGNYIGGAFVPALSGATLPVENPIHGRIIGHVADSGPEDVAAAVAAAQAAFPGWRDTPIKERVQVLYRLKALMERDLAKLGWVVTHENGKLHAESVASVAKGIECLEYGCSLPNLPGGGFLEVSRGVTCRVEYEPLGVVAGVVPFNFPIMVPMWMLPQALVAGNTFVMKPSEQTPYGMAHIAELLREAGLPPGVLNLVNGGRAAVEGLVDHPGVKAFGFVGSTKVAKLLYERGAQTGDPCSAWAAPRTTWWSCPTPMWNSPPRTWWPAPSAAPASGAWPPRCSSRSVTASTSSTPSCATPRAGAWAPRWAPSSMPRASPASRATSPG
jgi:malonate-semialdehyde dehydrogenase (acetylating)/methylmalonate-semialdehyde dehydrogenase